jgi:hypothetical protein
MCEFVAAYTKPDGRTPLIGDADDGRIQVLGTQPIGDHRYLLSYGAIRFRRPDFASIASQCWDETFWLVGPDAIRLFDGFPKEKVQPRSRAFPSGGFYILNGERAHVIVDCGEVGMRGRGGHGHNDILSFELFLNGVNVVTDCGAYLYTASREWRNRFRSTAFHNTLQVDDEELNRFLGPDALWQLHYDAKPVEPHLQSGERIDYFQGGHSGYTRLPAAVSHTRAFFVDRQLARVLMRDHVNGTGDHKLVWRFHLDPDVTPVIDGRDVKLASTRGDIWLMTGDGAEALVPTIEEGWVSPSYGVKVEASVLVWQIRETLPVRASFLFADVRLSASERRFVAGDLTAAAGVRPM